jgi:hypothetical protein
MTLTWNRTLSGLLAVVYIVGACVAGGAEVGFKAAMCVILPLACIWFGEAMGGYIGPTGQGAITSPTPGLLVCILGWVVLILPVIFLIVGVSCRRP